MSMSFTVVPHVHWDREWYFTEQKSRTYLDRCLTDVMDALDADPRVPQYLFDAQTSLIDDYLADHPEREGQLRRLVSARRLLTGPWYTQCDQMVVHGESIVRNLMYGTREAQELGHCLRVGYAPDCFGQAAQMPQILTGFDIPSVMFKRGIDTSAVPSDDFVWESDDGSRVFAYHLLDYMNFRNPSQDAEKNVERVRSIERAYEPRSRSGHAFLFNGFDQHPFRRDIADLVEAMGGRADVSFGDLEEALASMAATPELPLYRGELTSGETTRVHKSIYSSRADLKTLYSRAENLLVRIVEPLQAIAHRLTGWQEREMVRRAWKALMESSAHDSIGCCNSDEVNRDIEARLRTTLGTLASYERLTYRQMARGSACEPFSLQVYNYLPYERTEEVRATLLSPWPSFSLVDTEGTTWPVEVLEAEDVSDAARAAHAFAAGANNSYEQPYKDVSVWRCSVRTPLRVRAMGYETFVLREAPSDAAAPNEADCLENELLRVRAAADGTLEVTDKRSGHTYRRVLELADDVDAGDSYDWSSDPEASLVVSSTEGAAKAHVEGNALVVSLAMRLPADRDERAREVRSTDMRAELEVTLPQGAPVLLVRARVDNASCDHRLRVIVPADIPSEVSHADQTFGIIERPTRRCEAEARWERDGWDERPRTIEPMQSLCYLEGDGRVVSLMTDSVKEYQVVGERRDAIAYTLFRSFTRMGRPDLPDRPGRESGKPWATPDAALLGTHEFTFAVAFPETEGEAVRLASQYATPLRVHQEALLETSKDEFVFGGGERPVPQSASLLAVEGAYQMSIFKLAEDEAGGEILRLTQLDDAPAHVSCERDLSLTNLAETEERPYEETSQRVRNQIVTIRIKEQQ